MNNAWNGFMTREIEQILSLMLLHSLFILRLKECLQIPIISTF